MSEDQPDRFDDGPRTGPPATDEQINDAEARLGCRLPTELRELYRRCDGIFNKGGQWHVVWPLGRVVADTTAAWSGNPLTLRRDLVAFGDDGTGDPFCIKTQEEVPLSVYRWSWIDEDLIGTVEPFDHFLEQWVEDESL